VGLRLALDRERGRRSFARFVRLAWTQVEPNALVWNWHMDAMCEALEAVTRGEIRKLLINVPPGMSKSLIVSTFWPAWDWIQNPTRRFIFASYAQDISNKNAALHRDLVLSDWFQERWGETVAIGGENAKRVREFHNDQKGWRFSTSVGGQVTGRHGDVLCFDDLVKAQDAEGRNIVDPAAIEKANDFWFKTMHTRRADPPNTIHVGIMQRLHHEDAAAKCIAKGGYVHLNLPMEFREATRCSIEIGDRTIQDPRTEEGELLNPARFPLEVVAEDRTVMGAATFEAQMNQNPTPPEGAIFQVSNLQVWLTLPKGIREIITVDCSFKDTKGSDLVAIQAWGVKNPNYYLIDQILGRFNVMKTMEMIGEMKDRRPRSTGVYVEDKANGSAVMQILGDTIPGLIAWNPGTASKVSRAEAVAPLVESENVYTPDPESVGWVQPYKTALGRFPLIKHDDEIDASTMALLILHKPKHRRYRDAVRKMFANRD
jgi:predicted phage terminase large subunit-like protein